MDVNQLGKAAEKGQKGTWVDWEEARFKIRANTSKTYRKAIQKAAKGKSNHRLTKDIEAAEKFGIEAMSDGLLIDWEGITENGNELDCTRENRIKVLPVADLRRAKRFALP